MSQRTEIFDSRDVEDLTGRGIPVAEAERQLVLLRNPPAPPLLERACTVGDGIVRIEREEQERLAGLAEESRLAGRWSRFVPASGAATRMFQDLLLALALAPDGEAGAEGSDFVAGQLPPGAAQVLEQFLAGLHRFAFEPVLEQALARRGTPLASLRARRAIRPILAALLEPDGLGYASLPKGLIPFHRAGHRARTAFEEQIAEALPLVTDADGRARFHFTVPAGREHGFHAVLEHARGAPAQAGVRLEIAFSTQSPATDTLAAEPDGRPARDEDGRLLFRPAGHGALVVNLQQCGAERAFLKNIDNVAIDWAQAVGQRWARVLCGLADRLAAEIAEHRARLAADAPGAAEAALAFVREHFGDVPGVPAGSSRDHAIALLDRPLRVCGMVPNTGEPGGGPFWVRDRKGGLSRQIVEAAQVDMRSPDQRAIFGGGTHFNPVFMACVLRDSHGQAWDLERFVDPNAVIITRKAALGRERVVLERPGLWNGSMAGWLSLFVEVPGDVFTPVKTVLDLLRPEHQPKS